MDSDRAFDSNTDISKATVRAATHKPAYKVMSAGSSSDSDSYTGIDITDSNSKSDADATEASESVVAAIILFLSFIRADSNFWACLYTFSRLCM